MTKNEPPALPDLKTVVLQYWAKLAARGRSAGRTHFVCRVTTYREWRIFGLSA